jgi:hypothetical protein
VLVHLGHGQRRYRDGPSGSSGLSGSAELETAPPT